jgi:hypothetical protein
MLLHGLIHLMGFAKAFQLAEIEQLTLSISKPAGMFWLVACIIFVIAGAVYFSNKNWWWMVAGLGIVLSQVLIIVYWQDAKFGTIANIIILLICLPAYGSWNFNAMVNKEKQVFLSSVKKEEEVIAQEDVENLPDIIQLWMENAGVVGKEKITLAHFQQTGSMRTSIDGKWMPVKAKQYVSTVNPGFLWIADVKAAPYIHLAGRDKYVDGKGHMLIKLLSLISVADSKGKEIDQGAMVRYLAEIVWYPTAALENYITWQEVDSTTARATMTYGGITSSAQFFFNKFGEVVRIEAERYYDRKDGATMETWVVDIEENSYEMLDEIRVPTKAQVTWQLEEGNFTWYKLEIGSFKYEAIN